MLRRGKLKNQEQAQAESHQRDLQINQLKQDLDTLQVKYLLFDIESTRRERDYCRCIATQEGDNSEFCRY